MLSFATEIPIHPGHTSTEFLQVAQTWVLGSPHTRLTSDHFASFLSQAESRVEVQNEIVDTLRVADGEEDFAGVRYVRHDSGLEWRTVAVFARSATEAWGSVAVFCEASHPAVRLPPAKKPVLVRMLLKNLGGAFDGPLRPEDGARRLGDIEVDLAARLITGKAGCRLPIVYVSAGFQGRHVLDPDRLTFELAGMAHVVVEPNRPFSLRLRVEVGSENVYGGTIGVYWPDGGGRQSFYLGRVYESEADLQGAIVESIRVALTNRRPFDRCTWAHVQETASRQKVRALRADGSHNIEEYIETFGKELQAKGDRITDANREIERLQRELQIHQARRAGSGESLLRIGGEQEFYPNEVLSIVRAALVDARTRVLNDSRRQHVLDAVLQVNAEPEDIGGTMREKLKDLLRGAKRIDAKTKRGLEDLGLSITEAGKHYKLTFQDDERYTFTLPKSGSDRRGGLNAASDIGRLLF